MTEETLEALDLLAAQCGHAGMRNKHKKTIKEFIMANIVPEETYDALNRGSAPIPDYSKPTKEPMNQQTKTPHLDGVNKKEDQGGGVESILSTIVEIRQAKALIDSQLTELKKRAKVKIQKLNQVENGLYDSYESQDRGQMNLFDLPAVDDEIQAILDDPRI